MSLDTTALDDAQAIKKLVEALQQRMYDETFSNSASDEYEAYRVYCAHLLHCRYSIDSMVFMMTEAAQ